MVSLVMKYKAELIAVFEKQTDETGLWVSQSTMCRTFQRLKLPLKKSGETHSKRSLQSHAKHDDGTYVPFADRRKGMLAKTKRSAPLKPKVNEFKS